MTGLLEICTSDVPRSKGLTANVKGLPAAPPSTVLLGGLIKGDFLTLPLATPFGVNNQTRKDIASLAGEVSPLSPVLLVKRMEKWIQIEKAEVGYEISTLGRVRHPTRIIPRWISNNGYEYARLLSKEGKPTPFLIHRIVATSFIPNPDKKRCVNHKDACKTNNNISNLEWATDAENVAHAMKRGIRRASKEKCSGRQCEVEKCLRPHLARGVCRKHYFHLFEIRDPKKTAIHKRNYYKKFHGYALPRVI